MQSKCLCDYLDKGMNQADWSEVCYSSCTLFFWQQNNVGRVDNVRLYGSSRHRSVGATLLTCMNRVQRRDFGPSVRELDREGEDVQTRSFGVVGHRDAVVGVEELGVVVVDGAGTTTSQRRDDVEVVGRSRGRGMPGR